MKVAQLNSTARHDGTSRYELFFFRSAQRFFMASDIRFLPSGVIPPPFCPFDATCWAAAARTFLTTTFDEVGPSSTEIARSSRPLSCFSSSTIFRVSNVYYFVLAVWLCLGSFKNAEISC
jgi:hypothetical protein